MQCLDHSVVSSGVKGCKQLVGEKWELEAPVSTDGDINLDVADNGNVWRSSSCTYLITNLLQTSDREDFQ